MVDYLLEFTFPEPAASKLLSPTCIPNLQSAAPNYIPQPTFALRLKPGPASK